MFLNVLTWVVLIALAALAGILVVMLGTMPAKIARKRGHPQVDAINVTSWLGIITMGLLWPFALIWAYTRPPYMLQATGEPIGGATPDQVASLAARVESLEQQLREISGSEGRQP
jgi:hypothetical protein